MLNPTTIGFNKLSDLREDNLNLDSTRKGNMGSIDYFCVKFRIITIIT